MKTSSKIWTLFFLTLMGTLSLGVNAQTSSGDSRNPIPATLITQSGYDSATGTSVGGSSSSGSTNTSSSAETSDTQSDTASDTQSSEETPTEPAPETITLFQPGDTLIITFSLPDDTSSDTVNTVQYILGQRLFTLDKNGQLNLPVVGKVQLNGLNETQVADRLQAEPALESAELTVTRLPVSPLGVNALQPFGAGLFSAANGITSQYEPAAGLPIPEDYIVGPGDSIKIQFFGKNTNEYTLEVTPNGAINIPELGAIHVAGEDFAAIKQDIKKQVENRLIGITADISMGDLRSITVYVVGDVEQPGSYTMSALSTIGTALVISGGVKKEGSLRSIQLKRNNRIISTFDLYNLLLHGDRAADKRLQSGDVVFIPPVGATVGVAGEVVRPAIYELKNEKSVADVIQMAGGLKPDAYRSVARLQRIEGNSRTIININLDSTPQLARSILPGDTLIVPTLPGLLTETVKLEGHVKYPNDYQWYEGMRLTDILPDRDVLLPHADLNYVVVVRNNADGDRISVLDSNLRSALNNRSNSSDNPLLKSHDRIVVFRDDLTADRQALLEPILNEMRSLARAGAPTRVVNVVGMVRAPGDYPLTDNMRLSDLIDASGALQESAYTLQAELTRYQLNDRHEREVNHLRIDLAGALGGNPEQNLLLKPDDHLVIKQIPAWDSVQLTEIRGEVRFPGTYPVARGEQLSALIERAGGLTDLAFTNGSIFLRKDLAEQEQEQLDRLTSRLEASVASATLNKLSNPDQDETLGVASQMIAELKDMKATGRLVIDLPTILKETTDGRRSNADITLKDGDSLYIPPATQEVSVMGEVYYPTSHVWNPKMTRDDYINLSGGITEKSDDDRIYVIRANGQVVSSSLFNKSRWHWASAVDKQARGTILPGDTIIVPLKPDRLKPLELWTSVSQIFFQIGVTIAQLNRSGF